MGWMDGRADEQRQIRGGWINMELSGKMQCGWMDGWMSRYIYGLDV